MEHLKLSLAKIRRYRNRSHKSLYFRCQLLFNDIVVAAVENDGKGEENNYIWQNNIDMMEVKQYAAEKFPQYTDGQMDALIDEMLEAEHRDHELEQKCKKKLIFRLKGDTAGQYRTLSVPYSAEAVRWLVSKYGQQIDEITNDRLRAYPRT